VTAELLDIRDAGDRLVAVIRSHVPPEWERRPEPHGELITVRDGKVTEMVVYPTVDEALAAGPQPRRLSRSGASGRAPSAVGQF
jgi:hypothetical protein